ncbi:cupin domain-containing protein [Neobacillus niacini]|uniref:cupin domain-containing protein n=1 Tax=Neobacillus niacini TaxID=86668 RepID=UPI0039835F9F
MVTNLDYSSSTAQFTFDINTSPVMKKDHQNYINVLGIKQLNTLENVSLLDIFLSKGNVIEPHYHQNAAELVYCISGAAVVSILNPYTKQIQNYPITPGQVANVPHGWWHYEVATADNTHLLAIFNAPTPEVILGSDLIKLTPSDIMAHTYCLDENQWKEAIKPVQPSTFIGPTKSCERRKRRNESYFGNHNQTTGYIAPTYYQPQYRNPYWPEY